MKHKPKGNKSVICCLLGIFLLWGRGVSQNEIHSPYSSFGIGILSNAINIPQASMGGTAYAMQSAYFINYRNPASYIAFDSLSFIADAALSVVSSTLKSDLISQKNSFARFNYLTIGIPLTKYWSTSAGILPFSDVGYAIRDEQEEATYVYNGKGGLMQLYWGNAFRLGKGLSVGLNISYLFGDITHTRIAQIQGDNYLNSYIEQSRNTNGIYLSGGIQYFTDFSPVHQIGLGLTYESSAYIWVKNTMLSHLFSGEYNITSTTLEPVDTVQSKGSMYIPSTIGFGISYTYKKKLTVGADATWQNWARYKCMGQSDSLQNNLNLSLGIQFIPDPLSNKFVKRVQLRAGARYSTGYLQIRETAVNDFGVTLGVGLPLRTFNSHSSINLMLEYGQMGTTKSQLVMQQYFRINVSFILQEKWYQRMKME
ncbi:MAG: hypothetical protein LBR51_00530 [Bacteroidales bacterium]|jgi:hypothetical protein|nr:hypothetical protein [Bacteroidales bacterium]